MRPLLILDLSNIATIPSTDGKRAEWWRVEAAVAEFRRSVSGQVQPYGVADRSLRHKLSDSDRATLESWQRTGRAELPDWADPVICELVEKYPEASIVSNDYFRGLRREFPFLQGFDRIYQHEVVARNQASLRRVRLSRLGEAEISRAEEDELRTPLRLNDSDGARLLRFEWACDDPDCFWSSYPAIETLPYNERGRARCPECDSDLRQAGRASETRQLKLSTGGRTFERIPVTDGARLVVGRASGRSAIDVRRGLGEDQVDRVSREHLAVENRSGRVVVEDLGSTNGSIIRRADGTPEPLHPNKRLALQIGEAVILGGVLNMEISGRRFARGSYLGSDTQRPASETRLAPGEHGN